MTNAFSLDSHAIKDFEKRLVRFKSAIPIADQQARNIGVRYAQFQAKKLVKKKMIIRNNWTLGSIQIELARGGFQNPAKVGSRQQYMADQEFGATAGKGKGSEGRRMTTPYASGEGEQARPRRKLARGMNRVSRIRLKNKRTAGKSIRQRAVIAIQQAAKSGNKFVYLNMPWTKGKKGIYKVIGGRRRPRIKMVHSMKKPSVVIPKNPWLKPTVDETIKKMPKFYLATLSKQAKRHFK